jgi:hypothetical protein
MAFERQLSTNKGVGFHSINISVGRQNEKSKLTKQIHAGNNQTIEKLISVSRKILCLQQRK